MKITHIFRIGFFLFLSLLIVCVVNCIKNSSTSPETGAYKIEGRVVDTNGKGVEGVTVTVTGSEGAKTAASDTAGIFSVTGLKNGVYEVTLSKESILMAPSSITVTVSGSDKFLDNVVAQTFYIQSPLNLITTYSKSKDEFNLTWAMSDTSSVKMYFIAWSDSNVFDLGHQADEFTNSINKVYTLSATHVLKTMGYIAAKDSFIVYFTVSAVYKVYDENGNIQFDRFIGPRSAVDSALVYKK